MASWAHWEVQADLLWEVLPQWLTILPNDMLMPVTFAAAGLLPHLKAALMNWAHLMKLGMGHFRHKLHYTVLKI